VDGALPYRRAHAKRHDVQLQRGPSGTRDRPLTPTTGRPRPMREQEGPQAAGDRLLDVVVVGGGPAGLVMAWSWPGIWPARDGASWCWRPRARLGTPGAAGGIRSPARASAARSDSPRVRGTLGPRA